MPIVNASESLAAAFAQRLDRCVAPSEHFAGHYDVEDDDYAYEHELVAHALAVAEDLAASGAEVGLVLDEGNIFLAERRRGEAATIRELPLQVRMTPAPRTPYVRRASGVELRARRLLA